MANQPVININNYTLGRGSVYFSPFVDDIARVPKGEMFFGDVNTFNNVFKSTDVDHYTSTGGTREMDLSVTLQIDRSGSFITENISAANLALFFLGNTSTSTQALATVTGEVHTIDSLDRYFQLGATLTNPLGVHTLDSTTPATVTNGLSGGSSVTYTAGTDYIIDYDLGRMYVSPTGIIPAGGNVTVGYKALASTLPQVISGNTPVEGQIRFVSDNPTGVNQDALIPWAKITPNGTYDLIGDKLTALTFDLKILKKIQYNLEALYMNGRGVSS